MDFIHGPTLAAAIAGLSLLLMCLFKKYRAHSRNRPLPPGPAPLPLIGNLLDVPKVRPWITYRELSRKYGGIISLRAMGQCIIVINDVDIAVELLENRSAIYSSRAESAMVKVSGWDWSLGSMPYGPRWRNHRRLLTQHFHAGVMHKHHAAQEEGAQRLLVSLMNTPGRLPENVRSSLGMTIIRTTYGLPTLEINDEYIDKFEEAMASMELLLSGTSIIDFLPALARVPTWLPGTAYLRRLEYSRRLVAEIRTIPWKDAKTAIESGRAPPCVARELYEDLDGRIGDEAVDHEDMIKNTLGQAYSTAIDTTDSAMCSFFLAMSRHPEVQWQARKELDIVVGNTRLPQITDRDMLPYVNAVMKETLRWHVVGPMGLSHVNVEDDEYNGYLIPEQSIIMVNAWSLLHDPALYPEPEKFVPERYLKDGQNNPDVRDPATIAFGFGRRICPGKAFSEATLFIFIASVLHTLDISPLLDDEGQPVHIEPRATTGLLSRLEDCRCTIRARSPSAEALIRSLEL